MSQPLPQITLISGSDSSPLYAAITNLMRTLLPAMEKFGIAKEGGNR
jgi:hypothetical protein